MAQNDNSQKETLHFEVDSHLLLELGERLVAKPSIALAELVKNSYDADATSVTITFIDVSKEGGTIIVEDTGEGMTLKDIKTKWMRIGTDEKEKNPISNKYKRTRTGSKGIGRFACRLISKILILTSTAIINEKEEKERIRAIFEWGKIKSGSLVNDFSVEVSVEKVSVTEKTGTKLVLQDTRNPWSEDVLNSFKKEILGLVNPFPWEIEEYIIKGLEGDDPGIKINIISPEHPEIEGLLSDSILKTSWGKLEGYIDENGKIMYKVIITSTGREYDHQPPIKIRILGPASFSLYMFSLERLFAEVPGITLRDLRKLASEYGGVKVFLDGFRVFQYGEPGNDWLKLGYDRSRRRSSTPSILRKEAEGLERPMLSLPSNSQLFGAVFLSRKFNPKISVTVTRDRLLENRAFDELQQFVRTGIDWMTIKYAAHKAQIKKEQESEKKTDPITTLTTIEKIVDKQRDILGEETTNVIQQYIHLAKEDVIKQQEESITHISMLRVLASTGTMITVFNHELSVIHRRLMEIASDLQQFLGSLPSSQKNDYRIILSDIKAWGFSIKRLASMIGLMLGRDAREKKRDLSLRLAVDKMFAPFQSYLDDSGIEPINNVPADVRTPPMYESELHSILVNLMTNSIKALSEVEERKILVKSQYVNKKLVIELLDTGCGLEPERWEEVFEPFVSYSDPDLDFGFGTGLGLTIVRNIVVSYEGKINFTNPPEGWSTCLRIELPR
ncbi:MAG: sensor histidine kinase [Candidatus Helarchaeota archaeon]|nr:sensor histidine kinase [Candidatus Helarchaeota archaeon]